MLVIPSRPISALPEPMQRRGGAPGWGHAPLLESFYQNQIRNRIPKDGRQPHCSLVSETSGLRRHEITNAGRRTISRVNDVQNCNCGLDGGLTYETCTRMCPIPFELWQLTWMEWNSIQMSRKISGKNSYQFSQNILPIWIKYLQITANGSVDKLGKKDIDWNVYSIKCGNT